jgi:hypothetical protein
MILKKDAPMNFNFAQLDRKPVARKLTLKRAVYYFIALMLVSMFYFGLLYPRVGCELSGGQWLDASESTAIRYQLSLQAGRRGLTVHYYFVEYPNGSLEYFGYCLRDH